MVRLYTKANVGSTSFYDKFTFQLLVRLYTKDQQASAAATLLFTFQLLVRLYTGIACYSRKHFRRDLHSNCWLDYIPFNIDFLSSSKSKFTFQLLVRLYTILQSYFLTHYLQYLHSNYWLDYIQLHDIQFQNHIHIYIPTIG